jgi:hypothetical protein
VGDDAGTTIRLVRPTWQTVAGRSGCLQPLGAAGTRDGAGTIFRQ